MSSRVRRCGGCGGPLSEAADDRGTITCSFCGMVNEVSAPTPQPIVITVGTGAGRQIARAGSAVAVVVGVVVIFIVIAASVIVYQTIRPASGALEVVSREALRARELMRPLALTELPTLKERGHRQVNAPPPPGGWTAFDPVAAIPWGQRDRAGLGTGRAAHAHRSWPDRRRRHRRAHRRSARHHRLPLRVAGPHRAVVTHRR